MKTVRPTRGSAAALPRFLRPLFWEYDFARLSWDRDRDLVISRVLAEGDLDAIRWLIERLGKPELRRWIEARQGRGLDARQLRFWELILGLRHRQVSEWMAAGGPAWAGRRGG
jgi:hypothetical protein